MTALETVLLRKDIASLIVAIVAGLATAQFVTSITTPLVAELLDTIEQSTGSFKETYLFPTFLFAFQLLALELLLRLVILGRAKWSERK